MLGNGSVTEAHPRPQDTFVLLYSYFVIQVSHEDIDRAQTCPPAAPLTVSTSCRVPHCIQGMTMTLGEEPLQWAFTCLLLTALSSAADLIQDSLLH